MVLIHHTYFNSEMSILHYWFDGSSSVSMSGRALSVEPGANFFGLDMRTPLERIPHIARECSLYFQWSGSVVKMDSGVVPQNIENNTLYDFGPDRKHIYQTSEGILIFTRARINKGFLSEDSFPVRTPDRPHRPIADIAECRSEFVKKQGCPVVVRRDGRPIPFYGVNLG